jgi:hypothetical protein
MKPSDDSLWERAYEISGWNELIKRSPNPPDDPAFKATADRFWEVLDRLKADAGSSLAEWKRRR